MYDVRNETAWVIYNKTTDKTVLEVTSEGYAKFLCTLLNDGATVEEIKERKHPDLEYFKVMQIYQGN